MTFPLYIEHAQAVTVSALQWPALSFHVLAPSMPLIAASLRRQQYVNDGI
ncbi:hypothetical protein KUF54_07215 [Comamonas sp. Y33R10-2]|nr:hypothetical protein [Comamonas sp. Y33R10-2]QXZ10972.1 hypothetical protein KUF54_07215 [Comamonas sp. Y33R10-2]